MYLFTIRAVPDLDKQSADAPDFSKIGGAYVNAWIDFPDPKGAEALARFYIQDAGWKDKELDLEPAWIEDIDAEDERYQYYEEAFKYGSSLVFNTFPKDE
jgi:hypothetical protein